jgi:ABC-type multidrug transport system fused ATPase/permease subunit
MKSWLNDFFFVLGTARSRLPWVLLLMLAATLIDLLAVSLIAPFISIMLGQPINLDFLAELFGWIGLGHWGGFRILGCIIILVYIGKGFMAYWLNRRIVYFAERRRAELMGELLHSFQRRPYEYHLHHPSNVLINKVLGLTGSFGGGTLRSTLSICADAAVFLVLAAYLAWSNWAALLTLGVLLGVVFVVVAKLLRQRLAESYETYYRVQANIHADVAHSLAGLREVRILGREAFFRERVNISAKRLATQSAMQSALQMIPRSAVEASVVGFLVLFSFVVLGVQRQNAQLLPLLATFAVAGLRLMPVATGLLSNFNNIRANRGLLTELAADLRSIRATDAVQSSAILTDQFSDTTERFTHLELEKVSFRYRDSESQTLNEISLTLQRGAVLGIIGRSGAGKSTLADVMIGLLTPASGHIKVNDWNVAEQAARWQRMLAYIPQSIYLMDDTLLRNIALGVPDPEVDTERVKQAATQAQLLELIEQLPNGLDTVVGERGVRLSGGQRQRVAIARALYFGREVLVLDEATSALDEETEREIVAAIEAMHGQVTLVLIAHRLSTLRACDHIIRLEQGQIVDRGTPAEVFGRNTKLAEALQ